MTGAGVLKHIAGSTMHGDLTDQVQDQVFGGDAFREFTVHSQFVSLGLVLKQSLRCQHVLDFAGSDSEGECTELHRAWPCDCHRRRWSCRVVCSQVRAR